MAYTPKDLYIGQPSGGLNDPLTAPTLSASGTGNTLPTATYFVVYTYANAAGETLVSPEASISITLGQQLNITVPALPVNATAVNLYVSTSSGTETRQGSTASTSYTITAPLTAGTAKPTANTTISVLYTVPANTTAIIRQITMNNATGTDQYISLYIVPSGQTVGPQYKLFNNYKVPAIPQTVPVPLDLIQPIRAGYTIQAVANGVNFFIGGAEVA